MPANPSPGDPPQSPPRLGLSLRRPGLPAAPIGLLEDLGGMYRFRYVATVLELADFRPLIGFPSLHRTYAAGRLFPFFAQRVLQPDRPDFSEYVQLLKLPVTASPWELLARSGGTRKGDHYELLAEPRVDDDGRTSTTFFVRGLRFAPRGPASTEARLTSLRMGDALTLRPEPMNVVNPHAQLVGTSDDFPLGWVPDLLLPLLQAASMAPHLAVAALNSPPAPWHLRLLATLEARLTPGYRLFDRRAWTPISAAEDAPRHTPVSVA